MSIYKLNLSPEITAATDAAGNTHHSASRDEQVQRESPNGYHYYSLFRDCPRKWYIKYILGLSPPHTGKALIFGGVLHKAKEIFYTSGFDIDAMIQTFHTELDARAAEYERLDDYQQDKTTGPLMLDAFAGAYRTWDMEHLEILEVETPHEILLGPEGSQVAFTVKPDLIALRDGTPVVIDTKSTRWSISKTWQGVEMDDQVTSYVWAWNKTHPQGPVAKTAIADVMYQKGKVVKAERSPDIIITPFAQQMFEQGMYGTIMEITQKVLALEHYPWTLLFPRHGQTCGKFGCEYADICRSNIPPGKDIPGFHKDPWVGEVEKWLAVAQQWDEGFYQERLGLPGEREEKNPPSPIDTNQGKE